jgi:hypothetical protein
VRWLSLLALLVSPSLWAADITAPKEVQQHSLVRVSSVQQGTGYAWWILATDASGKLVFADVQKYDQDKSLVFTGPPGTYQIMLAVSVDGKLDQGQATVTILGGRPAPIPPGPTPPPDPPEPEPDPTPAGPRTLLIVHETADTTAHWAQTLNRLRTGPQAQYLASKSHRLFVLDDDSVGSDGKPSLEAWSKHLAGLTLPAVLILDSQTRAIVHKQSVPNIATADDVLAILKLHE